MKIYTRTGDSGETGLLGGARLSKSSLRVEAYGEVDELNAALGLARTKVASREIQKVLEEIQRDLFSVGALLADPEGRAKTEKISLQPSDVERLEGHIDRLEAELPPLKQFILPGGSAGGALLHLARSVCRRAERKVVSLSLAEPVPEPLVPYLNRLSDLLFVLARMENRATAVKETTW